MTEIILYALVGGVTEAYGSSLICQFEFVCLGGWSHRGIRQFIDLSVWICMPWWVESQRHTAVHWSVSLNLYALVGGVTEAYGSSLICQFEFVCLGGWSHRGIRQFIDLSVWICMPWWVESQRHTAVHWSVSLNLYALVGGVTEAYVRQFIDLSVCLVNDLHHYAPGSYSLCCSFSLEYCSRREAVGRGTDPDTSRSLWAGPHHQVPRGSQGLHHATGAGEVTIINSFLVTSAVQTDRHGRLHTALHSPTEEWSGTKHHV